MSHEQRNRANAQRSTGPRTPAGKAASSRNATRHGLCAQGIAPGEDRDERAAFLVSVESELAPEGGVLARELARHAARAAWSLRRADRAEAAALADPAYRRVLERASQREAATRPQDPQLAALRDLLGAEAPETAAHRAAVKDVGEAAARRADETADAAAFAEGDALDRIMRYRSAHERSLARSLDALARLGD